MQILFRARLLTFATDVRLLAYHHGLQSYYKHSIRCHCMAVIELIRTDRIMVELQITRDGLDRWVLQSHFSEHGIQFMQPVANLVDCFFLLSEEFSGLIQCLLLKEETDLVA